MILLYDLMLLSLVHAFQYLPESKGPQTNADQRFQYQAKITLVPYHALVFYSGWFCSGIIIGSKTILTTASCLLEPNEQIVVKVGVESIIDDGQIIPVVEAKKHEFYEHLGQLDNDIALLVLEHHVKFSDSVKKIVLAEADAALRPASSFTVTGWGSSYQPQHRVKKLTRMPLVLQNKESCEKAYELKLTPSMFCGRYQQNRRLSDSGGAAVYSNRFLVGIASYTGPDNSDVAVFTNVSYFHKWIKINTIRFLRKHCKLNEDTVEIYGEYAYDHT
ncbi:chymotrypsin-1-like isoform X2 [Choristoneura fumiferana]|uniref:chymotrypsin-1-like isoform X2 n=1 Tax=Choristoneura fumiferana TaxID=7141 RepID=UPI003D156C9F